MQSLQLLASLVVISCCLGAEPDREAVPCNVMAIISGRREETENCNLKTLLIRQMQSQQNSQEVSNFVRDQSPKRTFLRLETCEGGGSVCRISGRRSCICPTSFVCDPMDGSLHVCVKLRYFTQMEEMRR